MAGDVRTRLSDRASGSGRGVPPFFRGSLGLSLFVTAFSGCGEEPPAPPATPAAEFLDAVADTCLGRFRGKFHGLALEFRTGRTAPSATVALIDRPVDGRMHISRADGSSAILNGDASCTWRDPADVEPVTGSDRAALAALRDEVCAVVLHPLDRVQPDTAAWADGDTIRFETAEGDAWLLDVDVEKTLPRSLRRQDESLRVDYLELSRRPPALPRVVEIQSFEGPRHLKILGDQLRIEESNFAPPSTGGPEPAESSPEKLEISPGPRPRAPVFQKQRDVSWLCVRDPGTWAERVAACRRLGSKLGQAGQKNGGDPLLFEDDEGDWLVIPFVPVGSEDDGYRVGDGERVIRPIDGTEAIAVVLAPEADEIEARIAAGRAMLEAHLAAHGRRPGGPLRTVVNLMFEDRLTEGSPRERTVDLRLELPVAAR